MSTQVSSSEADCRPARDARPDPRVPIPRTGYASLGQRFLLHEPDRPAIIAGSETWTYRELTRASEIVAAKIQASTALSERPVAIYARRHPGLVVALLGIIRSGHPFMILDPKYPVERTLRCIELAQPAGLLSLVSIADVPKAALAAIDGFRLALPSTKDEFLRSAAGDAERDASSHWPGDHAAADTPMYWAFTSGTTGLPRAIVGAHGPVAHYFGWETSRFGLSSRDRVSVLSGLAHDPLLRDVLLPLWFGGAACIPEEDVFERPGRMYEWFKENRITVAHLTPSTGQLLLSGRGSQKAGPLESLRLACFGGDALRFRLAQRFQASAPAATVVNCYGTTETPQVMGYHVVDPVDADKAEASGDGLSRVPIGKGIEGCQLLVLSDSRELCRVGDEGEIFVRTQYRALRVVDRGEASRGCYERNPFTDEDDDLLYRTGDYGQYLPDGSVLHKGRRDRQVKVRGFRIALEELDRALAELKVSSHHIDVEEVDGQTRLGLYVVGTDEARLDESTLRQELHRRLPSFMVPERICVVPSLPLTPNGKVDSGRLRQIGASAPAPAVQDRRTVDGDDELIRIVQRVLVSASITAQSDLVSFGLNSLQAVEICCALEERYGVEVSASDIVKQRTVEGLGRYLREQRSGAADAGSDSAAVAGTPETEAFAPQLIPENEGFFVGIRNRVLQLAARVAPDVWRVAFHRARGVSIGKNVSIGYDSIVETAYPWLVALGDNVNIGMRVTIIGHFRGMSAEARQHATVRIEKDAFVGPGVLILPNVTIGEGAVVAAGSVVNESVAPYTLVQGNPAKPKARCGVALSRAVTYEEFVARLRPLRAADRSGPSSVEEVLVHPPGGHQ